MHRARALAGDDAVRISTLGRLADASLAACPWMRPEQCLTEPDKRDTAGALIWAMASLCAEREDRGAGLKVAVLTSDQRIGPDEAFLATVHDALDLAEAEDGLAVIGIPPDRPETGFGYLELGEPVGPGRRVDRFREKPDAATAEEFVASGRHLWNAGMFFWTASAFRRELGQAQPQMAEAYDAIIEALADGRKEDAVAAFQSLEKLSIDFALMEKAERVFAVAARFDWDDLGAWDSLPRSLGADAAGNAVMGKAQGLEAEDCIVFSPEAEVSLIGVSGLVVVVAEGKVLVMPRSRAQDVKRLASEGRPLGG